MLQALVVVFALGLITPASATDFPDDPLLGLMFDSDSGIQGPAYSKIVDELNQIAATHAAVAKVHRYGTSPQGRPLTLIKIARPGATVTMPAIYIGGSIHGNEYLNIEDRLPRWFAEAAEQPGVVANYLAQGGAIYIAPILNPDGYDRRRRANSRGVDLNRDYTVLAANVTGLKETETKSLVDFLNADLALNRQRLELAMDYHCCIGALLYPWSFTGPTLSPRDRDRHLAIAQTMQKNLGTELKFGTTPLILGYSAKGTSKDFYFEHFGALGFTFEGRVGREDRYFPEHTAMWSEILASIPK